MCLVNFNLFFLICHFLWQIIISFLHIWRTESLHYLSPFHQILMSFRIFLFQNEWKSLKRLFHVCSFVKSKAQLLHWLLPHNYLLLQGYNMIPWNGQKVDSKKKEKGLRFRFFLLYILYSMYLFCFIHPWLLYFIDYTCDRLAHYRQNTSDT